MADTHINGTVNDQNSFDSSDSNELISINTNKKRKFDNKSSYSISPKSIAAYTNANSTAYTNTKSADADAGADADTDADIVKLSTKIPSAQSFDKSEFFKLLGEQKFKEVAEIFACINQTKKIRIIQAILQSVEYKYIAQMTYIVKYFVNHLSYFDDDDKIRLILACCCGQMNYAYATTIIEKMESFIEEHGLDNISRVGNKFVFTQKEYATTILHYYLSVYSKLPDLEQLEKQSLCKTVCDKILSHSGDTCIQDFLLTLFYFKLDYLALEYIDKYPTTYENHRGYTHIDYAMKFECFLSLEHLIKAGAIDSVELYTIVLNFVNKYKYCLSIKELMKTIGAKFVK